MELILYRQKRNGTIYLIDREDGTIYGSTRALHNAGTLWMRGQVMAAVGVLRPLPLTASAKAARKAFLTHTNLPRGYVRTVLGWEDGNG